MTLTRTTLAGLATVLALALTACTPGGSSPTDQPSKDPSAVSTDAATMGDVTLTVWDQEVLGGQEKQMTTLNALFQKKYPNIKINRVPRSFDDLQSTLRLAISGTNVPDVVQANNSRSQMGAFVTAGQLTNLDPYAKAYGWDQRYPAGVRKVASYSTDGKVFGEGSLYGLPQVGELVGIYYNDATLRRLGIAAPTTWAEFDSALAAVKEKGEVPLVLGNLDKWPAGHVFGLVQGRYVPAAQIRTLGYGQSGGSWDTPENLKAAQTVVDWVDKGYFNSGFNGEDYDHAWQGFSKGKGVFLIAGSWLQADLSSSMNSDVKFMLPPPSETDGKPVTTGASGLPWSIPSKSAHPDAAAAYIDFITSPEAMKVLAETGNLPVIDSAKEKAPTPLSTEVFSAYDEVSKNDGLVPYLDWATPTMADTLGASLQDLMGKKVTPQQYLDAMQKDYGDFTGQR